MIEFREGRYFVGLWFLVFEKHDVLFTLFTDEDPAKPCIWDLHYRFRHYDLDDPGNDPFSGKDRKTFYSGRTATPMTDEEAKVQMETAISLMNVVVPPKEQHFCPIYSSDPKKCMELLQKQPWAHMKQISKEEYEEKYEQKGEAQE